MLKKRTFFVSGFLQERICGFFQNFFQTYPGSQKKTIFFCFALSASVQKLELFSWIFEKKKKKFFADFHLKMKKYGKIDFIEKKCPQKSTFGDAKFFPLSLQVFAQSQVALGT